MSRKTHGIFGMVMMGLLLPGVGYTNTLIIPNLIETQVSFFENGTRPASLQVCNSCNTLNARNDSPSFVYESFVPDTVKPMDHAFILENGERQIPLIKYAIDQNKNPSIKKYHDE